MRALLPALLVAAACNEPNGLTLEVVPLDPSIEYVEVYLADTCPDCPDAMAPPGNRVHAANIYQTDYSDVWSATKDEPGKWKNGHAFFRIQAEDTIDGTLPYLLMIGFGPNKTPIAINRFAGVTVPTGSEYWQVELDEPVAPLTIDETNVERIAIWPMNRTGPRCVMIVNGDRADAVVPKDDPDCDGLMSHECAPYQPNAVRAAPTIENASCPVFAPAAQMTPAYPICLLGGPPCTDGQPTPGCEALDVDYCMPMKACASCAATDTWDACVKLKLSSPDINPGIVPYELCNVAMQQDGKECTDSSKRSAELDLGGLLGSGGTKCTSIAVHDLALPIAPFQSKIAVNGATLELVGFQEPCKVDLQWSGDLQRTTGGIPPLVLDVSLDNGKHLLLPFVVRGMDSCTNNSNCMLPTIDPTESMTQCTKPTMDSTTCTGTNACAQAGATCGARCCGIGESCVDGECRCGDGPHCVTGTLCVSAAAGPTPLPGACGNICCGGPGAPPCPG